MTKDELQKRLQFLQEQRQERIDQANALSGAVEECKFWLTLMDEPKRMEAPVQP
jgi:hypothetical protein